MKLVVVTLFLTLMNALSQVNVIDVKLELNKKIYMSTEHIHATVTLMNRGAEDIRLHNQNGNWLDFMIRRNGVKDILMAKNFLFADCVVPAGKQVSRKITLTHLYELVQPGNYVIRARVKPPGENVQPSPSSPAFFDVFNGVDIYRQQYGVPERAGQVVEYRIKQSNTRLGTELYFQAYDPKRKRLKVTYSIGKFTGIHKVQAMADSKGYLHTLYPIDAKLFRYINFADDGSILNQQIVKQAVRGIPVLTKVGDGKVGVRNGVGYDPVAERKKKLSIHNISQRPPFSYR